jgi:hypothetical protein
VCFDLGVEGRLNDSGHRLKQPDGVLQPGVESGDEGLRLLNEGALEKHTHARRISAKERLCKESVAPVGGDL